MLTLAVAASIGNESASHQSFLSQHEIAPRHAAAIAPRHGTKFQECRVLDHLRHMSASAKVANGRVDCRTIFFFLLKSPQELLMELIRH